MWLLTYFMDTNELEEYTKTLKILTERGYRPQYSCPEFALLSKPIHSSCIHVAQVTKDGKVNTKTLSDFLSEVLDQTQPREPMNE